MLLYHTGPVEIRQPDIRYGRKNADFGQGFYLTPNIEFAEKWVKTGSACLKDCVYIALSGMRNGSAISRQIVPENRTPCRMQM